MTDIDHHILDETQRDDIGEAIARRLANGTPLAPVAQTAETDESASEPSPDVSTDSTSTSDEDAATPTTAPVTTDDAGVVAGEGAPLSAGSADDGAGDGTGASPAPASPPYKQYTDAQIERMAALAAWADKLDPQLARSMAAIEHGQAAAVSREEFMRYQAWLTTQQHQQPNPQDELLQDLDPQQRAYVEQLARENEQLRTAQQQPPYVDVQREQQQIQAQLAADAQIFVNTAEAWRAERGLTEQEVASLIDVATNHGVFATFAEQERQYHPVNGSLLRPADMSSVTEKALNYALVQDPGLMTRVLTAQQTSAQQTAALAQADAAVSQKKARGGSLAAAPSGAQITPPVDVTKMTPTDLRAAMAADIAQREPNLNHHS